MPNYYEKMLFEMDLRGYSPSTKKHYLSHIRLLERSLNKPFVYGNLNLGQAAH